MLFCFDYDGVIVDSFDQLLSLTIQAQQVLGEGREPNGDDFRRIENLAFDDLGRRIGLSEASVSEYANKIFDLQESQWEVQVFPEMVEVLRNLAVSHQLIVITSSQSEAVASTLDDFGIGSLFSNVLGGELGLTKAQRIEQSSEELACQPNHTYMVGDAISDIRQGKNAGVKTVAVSWGYQDRKLLERESPDHIIDSPNELLEIAA